MTNKIEDPLIWLGIDLSRDETKRIRKETIAEVEKMIDEEIRYEENFFLKGFRVRTSVKLLEELKQKLTEMEKQT